MSPTNTIKMRSTGTLQLLLSLCLLPLALCVTERTAEVKIRNNTPNLISGVGVSHKYSDVYKEQYNWDTILEPWSLSEESMTVTYNTGFLTTGRDWWLVTYHREEDEPDYPPEPLTEEDSVEIWYSDPNNFRNIFDFLEGLAPDLISEAIDIATAANPLPLDVPAVANIASEVICGYLFNDESTDGFKQHILREEDEGEITEIIINDDNTITFHSVSGDSETVTSIKWIEAEHE